MERKTEKCGNRSRGGSCSFAHDVNKGNREKKKVPFSVRNEKTLEGDGKVDTKGKGPKIPVRQETQTSQKAQKGKAERNPHVIVGIHQNVHTAKLAAIILTMQLLLPY